MVRVSPTRIPDRYAQRMSPQIAVRLPASLLDDVDSLVDAERRARIGRAIVEGYERVPQAEALEEELGAYPAPGADG